MVHEATALLFMFILRVRLGAAMIRLFHLCVVLAKGSLPVCVHEPWLESSQVILSPGPTLGTYEECSRAETKSYLIKCLYAVHKPCCDITFGSERAANILQNMSLSDMAHVVVTASQPARGDRGRVIAGSR